MKLFSFSQAGWIGWDDDAGKRDGLGRALLSRLRVEDGGIKRWCDSSRANYKSFRAERWVVCLLMLRDDECSKPLPSSSLRGMCLTLSIPFVDPMNFLQLFPFP